VVCNLLADLGRHIRQILGRVLLVDGHLAPQTYWHGALPAVEVELIAFISNAQKGHAINVAFYNSKKMII